CMREIVIASLIGGGVAILTTHSSGVYPTLIGIVSLYAILLSTDMYKALRALTQLLRSSRGEKGIKRPVITFLTSLGDAFTERLELLHRKLESVSWYAETSAATDFEFDTKLLEPGACGGE